MCAQLSSPKGQRFSRWVFAAEKAGDLHAISVTVLNPFEAGPEHVMAVDGIILGTTENLGYMSGALKDCFDRTYYGVIGRKQCMPYAVYIRAGSDGTGTQKGIERIVTGLRWRAVQPPLMCRGPFDPTFTDQCAELGMAMAAGLEAGVI